MIRENSLVRIGKGTRVYRVSEVFTVNDLAYAGELFNLESDAKHPDAAKRLPDAFRQYAADELALVD